MENENIKQPHKYGKITRRMSFQDWNRLNFWLIDEFPEKKVAYAKDEAKELFASMKRNITIPEGSLDKLVEKFDKKGKKNKKIPEEKLNKKLDKTITKILRRKKKEIKRAERKEKKKDRQNSRSFSEVRRTGEAGNFWRSPEYFQNSLNDRTAWESEFMQNF
jgi:hypothetical protein